MELQGGKFIAAMSNIHAVLLVKNIQYNTHIYVYYEFKKIHIQ